MSKLGARTFSDQGTVATLRSFEDLWEHLQADHPDILALEWPRLDQLHAIHETLEETGSMPNPYMIETDPDRLRALERRIESGEVNF